MDVEAVTWAQVASQFVTAVPAIIAAIASCLAVWKTVQTSSKVEKVEEQSNKAAVEAAKAVEKLEVVHVLVNGKMGVIEDKLNASLLQIAALTGTPVKTVAQAPTTVQLAAEQAATVVIPAIVVPPKRHEGSSG